ncbi:unnamed protein product [Spirodela intermedia]|uniref:Uncharacterized protein n=1 Tax=Spirodela intermedia TaxID=51605 RepID=A0A7I8J7D2_SPIIN|nr:unnamed protein product [Spirodela intermedia]CAA6666127.1 unnamed protein product [Spirodela intermedia]
MEGWRWRDLRPCLRLLGDGEGRNPKRLGCLDPSMRNAQAKGDDKLEEIGMARLNLRDMVSKLRGEAANGSSDRSQTLRELPNFLPQGWEEKELISREGKTKLSTGTFFASIDQRDDSAGGESACAVLAVVIADKLQRLSEWRKLCEAEPYASRFSDKHFDLETVMEANLRPVAVSPENSFVGFFLPESFDEIAAAAEEGGAAAAKVYIVSWNDHFFLLKAEAEAFYVRHSRERLSEGCDKAYVLKFDEGGAHLQRKSCCREFINRFLVAIPLREELEAEEKRRDGPPASTTLSTKTADRVSSGEAVGEDGRHEQQHLLKKKMDVSESLGINEIYLNTGVFLIRTVISATVA